MKTRIGFFSIVVVTIIALGLRAAEAEVDAQATEQASKTASVKADFERMQLTATQTCERLRQYLQQIEESEPDEEIPSKIYEVLDRGCSEADALKSAISDRDKKSARRHYRVATRAMAKVSRWLLQRAEKLAVAQGEQQLKKRLHKILNRMVKRVQKLQKRVEEAGLEVDFTLSYSIYDAVIASVQEKDAEAAREHLKELRQEIFKIEDEIAQQQEEVL